MSQAFDRCSRLMVQEVLRILGFGELLISSISNLPIDNTRIGRGLARGAQTFNSAKTERASVELSLAAMRSERDISRITEKPQRPCMICGCYEKYDDSALLRSSSHRGFYRHVFLDCTPAAYLRQFMVVLAVKILGVRFNLTLASIMLNEIPIEIFKRTNQKSRKTWFAILNCYKTTLFSIYYLRPKNLNEDLIIRKFNQNLLIVRRIAQKRNSNLLDNICLPRVSFYNIVSLSRIHRIVMLETRDLRREDGLNRRTIYLDENRNNQNLNANIPRKRKIKNAKPFSAQKRQILISAAFKKMQKRPRTDGGNIELSLKNQIDQ